VRIAPLLRGRVGHVGGTARDNLLFVEAVPYRYRAALGGVPGKVEGVALVNCTTFAIANDNDFNIGTFDGNGNNANGSPVNSVIPAVTLDASTTNGCINTSAFIRTIQGLGRGDRR